MIDIVALGEILIDLFAAETGRPHGQVSAFRPVPGGAPANVAVAAARLGCRAAFIGKVGDDPFGRELVDVLRRNGVETSGMRFELTANTSLNFMAKPDPDHCDCLFYRGADLLLGPADVARELCAGCRVYHFGSLSLVAEPNRSAALAALAMARDAGAIVSFDVNYRPTLWPSPERAIEAIEPLLASVDIVKVNEDEAAMLGGTSDLGEAAERIAATGPKLVVVTRGPDGCLYRAGRATGAVEAFHVKAVDATGCGDTFVAALLCGLIRANATPGSVDQASLERCLRFAGAAAAITAMRLGVIPALPTPAEVERFIEQQP